MKPEKFLKSYKCDCFQPENYCNCSYKVVASDALTDNVADVAESLIEVMSLCGIVTLKAKLVTDIIINYFLHFKEIVHRIDSVPRKRLNKENLMHDLSRKCFMNRVEAQMSYSIIKRAFKAFYHGTGLGGVPNILLRKQLTHSSECLWVHAAQRTAQIYASYEGIFYPFKKDLERKIKLVYKQLYDRILNRIQLEEGQECICRNCMKRIKKETLDVVAVTTGMHDVHDQYEAEYLKEQDKYIENSEDADRSKHSCSCPSLSMTVKDYVHRENAEATQNGPSQGPFECRWVFISNEEYEADDADMEIKLPCEYPCPPCHSDEECDLECECTCEDCNCKSDSQKEYEDRSETEHEFGNGELSALTCLTLLNRDILTE